jgi:hypothetical protein
MERLTSRRGALAAVAAVAGGVVLGRRGDGASLAAGDGDDDAVLNLFLTLERVQQAFYRAAVGSGGLSGEPLELAKAVEAQEAAHVAKLEQLLGSRAGAAPKSDFGDATSSANFLGNAVTLEEAAIGVYVGQAGNLSRSATATVATLVSVEARQVAWLRDIAGMLPAPHAADPARPAQDVLGDLRKRGWLA